MRRVGICVRPLHDIYVRVCSTRNNFFVYCSEMIRIVSEIYRYRFLFGWPLICECIMYMLFAVYVGLGTPVAVCATSRYTYG